MNIEAVPEVIISSRDGGALIVYSSSIRISAIAWSCKTRSSTALKKPGIVLPIGLIAGSAVLPLYSFVV